MNMFENTFKNYRCFEKVNGEEITEEQVVEEPSKKEKKLKMCKVFLTPQPSESRRGRIYETAREYFNNPQCPSVQNVGAMFRLLMRLG